MMKKKERRFFQFTLRSILVVMLVVAGFFAGRVSVRPTVEAMKAEAERQRAIAASNQLRAADAMYQLNSQLAERSLTAAPSDAARTMLLQQAVEHHQRLLENGGDDEDQ